MSLAACDVQICSLDRTRSSLAGSSHTASHTSPVSSLKGMCGMSHPAAWSVLAGADLCMATAVSDVVVAHRGCHSFCSLCFLLGW